MFTPWWIDMPLIFKHVIQTLHTGSEDIPALQHIVRQSLRACKVGYCNDCDYLQCFMMIGYSKDRIYLRHERSIITR